VVVSLWDVPDRSTSDFMLAFYRRLLAGQDAGAALRASKIDFLGSSAPGRSRIRLWAPFILVGDPVNAPAASTVPASRTTR
jgi:CHAT domain-containing protein